MYMLQRITLTSSILLCMALCACTGGGAQGQIQPGTTQGADTLRDTLAQLDAMPVPEGADAATFAMLKRELRQILIARASGRYCSEAPETNRSKVTDLTIEAYLTGARCNWTYKNEGDFNQSGTVNISDLSILGINYGKNESSVDWDLAKLADGNGDGQVDIRDLTSIGIGFGRVVTRYLMVHSTTNAPGSRWDLLGESSMAQSGIGPDGLRKFELVLQEADGGYFCVVPCHMEERGISSDPVVWNLATPGDWSMFGRDRQHTHRSPYTGPATNALKWKYQTTGGVASSLVLTADGTVYCGCMDGLLYAVNPDGSLKWANYACEIDNTPAIGMDGTLYLGTNEGSIIAVKPDGSLIWKYTVGAGMRSCPVIGTDGTVYIGSGDGKLYAMNADGSLKWSYTTGDSVCSSPAIGVDGTIYVGSYDYNIYAINPDGSLKWSYPTGWVVFSSPAIGADGTVYVGGDDNLLYAINPDGSLKWTYSAGGGDVSCSPAIGADGTIYVGIDNFLYAINPDGTLQWTFETNGYVWSSPAIDAQGSLYFGSNDEKIYALNHDGSLKWYLNTDDVVRSSPAIGPDGTIYVGNWTKWNSWIFAIGPGGG